MATYIFNKNAQPTGEHEVHNANTCKYLPNLENRVDLGYHDTCQSAVKKAKELYKSKTFDGCYYCCLSCHTR